MSITLSGDGSITGLTSTGISAAQTVTSVTSAALPAGSVLQVVNATYSTQVTSTSSTLADTGLTATITPKFSTSKILVLVSQATLCSTGSGNLTVNRAGTDIATFGYGTGLGGGGNTCASQSITYLDSPATTSATIYKTRFNRVSGAGTVYMQYADGNGTQQSVITLMEIAA